MKYITHHDFNFIGMCGESLYLPAGTEVQCNNNIISTMDEKPICLSTSENGKKYFCRNDDGFGMERGALTYAIAYSPRFSESGTSYRFTDEETDTLYKEYNYWLRDRPVILFNDDFFTADVDDLKILAEKLNISY